ncbi:MAG: selenium metabolism-associated LysR family transcriptional regulator [Candidatus Desulforudaceae bacterium]|nr:LysR family transcriptional regulator [Bacillota bacterium]MBV1727937.1 LysR family transcriptional regulator [Desulforudis sp.]MDQ7789620.1 selenium metabolism-associated LysR family transcriptional regulator [Clostridia bacterium]
MNLNYLETLVAVARYRSFSHAAHTLNLTQPAVSKHISLLEQHYGIELVSRTSRRVELTDAGQVLYNYSVQLLDTMARAYEDVRSFAGEIKGTLNIGASTIPGHYVLPPLLGRFASAYPDVKVSLEIANTGKITARLREEAIHIGAVGAPVKEDGIACQAFAEDEIVLAVPVMHPFADRREVDPSELIGERMVTREKQSGTRRIIEENLRLSKIPPDAFRTASEFGSTEAVLAAVEAGLGLSFVSRWSVRRAEELNKIKTIPVKGLSISRSLYLIYARDRVITRPAQAFLDFILQTENGDSPE